METQTRKRRKTRATVLVRLDRGLKDDALGYAKRRYETLSTVLGEAVTEYLERYSSCQK
ncbi:MAG: hypothetical protein WAV11_02855 [Minisyncoccia bacterium]